MKKFIVLYYAPQAAEQNMQANPEDMKGVMAAWMAWGQKCGAGMVDMGTPLGNAMRVMPAGASKSDSQVVGYSVLQAESMEEATKMLEGHPHLNMSGGCSIEVHESMPLPA